MTNYQLQIKSFVFGPFETNCYVVSDEQQILLVDPACSNESERQQLVRYIENLSPSTFHLSPFTFHLSIIATHGHLDHLWGAAWVCAKWNTPVLMHEADIPMAKAMQQQYDLFGIRAKAQPFPIEDIKSKIINHKFEISNFQLLETPGHTPGSVCLYFPKSPITNHQSPIPNYQSPILFSGDTLFHMGYGRTDLPGGNYSQFMNSLDLLLALPPETVVYPGHGEHTTIGAEARWIVRERGMEEVNANRNIEGRS